MKAEEKRKATNLSKVLHNSVSSSGVRSNVGHIERQHEHV